MKRRVAVKPKTQRQDARDDAEADEAGEARRGW